MNNPDRFELIRFRSEIEHEDDRRRMMTRFAYRFANDWFAAFWKAAMVILLLQVLVVFGLAFAGGLPRGAASDPRSLLIFTPMAILPVLPLLIFKWRYARWGIFFLAVLSGLAWLGVSLQGWVVAQLS